MYEAKEQYYVEMMVNGEEMPIVPGTFEQIAIVQNVTTFLPSYRINIYSGALAPDELRQIVDGVPVTFQMGRSLEAGEEEPRVFEFRSFGPPINNQQGGHALHTNVGLLDASGMKYIRDQPKGVFEGSSGDALGFIAGECGLEINAPDGTDDFMKWILARRSYASIASYICDHGWASDTSMMSLGVDEDKILHYRNLETVIGEGPKARLYIGDAPPEGTGTGPDIHVEYYEPRYTSGLNNSTFAYPTYTNQEQLDGSLLEYRDVSLTKFSGTIEINSEIHGALERVRTEWSPADCGNCHDHFIQAAHQNRRLRSSFSMGMETTHVRPTGLRLYDVVEFWMNPEVHPVVARQFNGNYFITAKTRVIQSLHYAEKLKLTAQGRNTDRTGQLF